MSFVQPQGGQGGRNAGIGVAIVFHVVLIWALANGLASELVQAINEPVEMKVIDEVKPPPPPPKVIEMPPPPKFTPPPPAYVPPPEVQVTAPPTPAPVITATASEPPPAPPPPVAPRVEAPAPPPAPPAPKPAPVPAPAPAAAPVTAGVACPNFSQVMGEAGFPREAQRAGLEEGTALVQFTLGAAGEVKDIKTVQSSHPSFAKGAMRIVADYRCQGQGRDITVQVPFVFKSS
jgi:periplasmic protein TonB